MRGTLILAVFFLVFMIASLLIPAPLFPGTYFCTIIGGAATAYIEYISAFFNGLFYGAILWLVFTLISRRLEK
jgi:hypothetical protein